MPTFVTDTNNEVFFSDGEHLDHDDFIAMQRLRALRFIDGFARMRWELPGTLQVFPDIRPLKRALRPMANGVDRDVTFRAGPIFWFDTFTAGGEVPLSLMHHAESDQVISIDANALGFERWDIVTAKVEELTGDNEVRHTEDAVTRAKTSLSIAKKRFTRLTLNYIVGTVATTEPAVPAGEIKIARIEVPNGAGSLNASNIVDFRRPASGFRWDVPIQAGIGNANMTFTIGGSTDAWFSTANVVNALLMPITPPFLLGAVSQTFAFPDMRLAAAHATYSFTSGISAIQAEIVARDNQWLSAGNNNVVVRDVSSSFPLTAGAASVVTLNFVNDPVWVNGGKNPEHFRGLNEPMLNFLLRFTTGGGDQGIFRGLSLEFYGE